MIFRMTATSNHGTRAQSTIELTAAILACIVLLGGVVDIFMWMNKNIVVRQERFQATRQSLTTVDFYDPAKENRLDVFH